MSHPSLADTVATAERIYIGDMLTVTHGQVAKAAKLAGVRRVQFWRLIKRHGIQPKDYAPKAERPPMSRTWLQGVAA